MINSVLRQAALIAVIGSVSDASAQAGQTTPASGETVTVRLRNQQTLTAQLDRRTDRHQLWLRFGGGITTVLRPIHWERVSAVEHQGRRIAVEQLRSSGASAFPLSDASSNPRSKAVTIPGSFSSHTDRACRLLRSGPRVSSVQFDAHLANWDRDIATDGLIIHLLTTDRHGFPIPVRGVLKVECVSMHRVAFHHAPRSRGAAPRRLGSWTVRIDSRDFVESGATIKLPFRANHPEFDTDWAPHGLVHIRLVVPGHGVFERSLEGVRVRPFAPFRDALERQRGGGQ